MAKALTDVLHRIFWLLENQGYRISARTTLAGSQEFITTIPNKKSVLSKLLANWKSLISEEMLFRKW